MRSIVLFIIFILLAETGIAQAGSRFQTYQSVMKISAFKNGENQQWENKNVRVVLDYQSGEFTVKLDNRDFYQNQTNLPVVPDSMNRDLEYTFKGILPIREIINQKQIKQNYVFEAQLINYDLSLNNPVKFDVNVTNPGTSQNNYRIFMMHGKLYNDELHLPAFEGFDNEIEIWLGFNGYMVGQ
jgi:hypothetical protein